MTDWLLEYDSFDPAEEPLREALCTLGNGYFATRGAAEESQADGLHYPGTCLAGGYNRLETGVAGRMIENEDIVNIPNWLPLTFRPAGGEWLDLGRDEVLSRAAPRRKASHLLHLNPCLPEELQGLRLRIRYRGRWLELDVDAERMRVRTPDGWTGPTKLVVRDTVHEFRPGIVLELPCRARPT